MLTSAYFCNPQHEIFALLSQELSEPFCTPWTQGNVGIVTYELQVYSSNACVQSEVAWMGLEALESSKCTACLCVV